MRYTILFSLIMVSSLWGVTAEQTLIPPLETPTTPKLEISPAITSSIMMNPEVQERSHQLIDFKFQDKPLVDILNELSATFKINILLPQFNQLTSKVTYSLDHKIPLKEAWDRLTQILDMAGFSWEERGNILTLVKTDKAIRQDPLPWYINEPLENLPDNSEIIKAVFYLYNMRVGDDTLKITDFIQNLLSPTADVKKDDKKNALILIDKANYIRGAMQIIRELDLNGLRESLEILPLLYAQAKDVENLFTNEIYKREENATQASYFPRNTKVIAITRNNALALLGTTKSIDRIRDFIIKYIDRPLESGDSMLHIYDLQYLESQSFVSILRDFIKSGGDTGQATTQAIVGPKQDFKNVLIAAENAPPTQAIQPSTQAQSSTPAAPTTGVQQGGNRLIIAAQKNDWIRIKKLVELVDKPQPQVALEVLVVDLNLSENRIIGSQMRDKSTVHSTLNDNINFQTTHLGNTILPTPGTCETENFQQIATYPANALMANLLAFTNNANGQGVNLATTSSLGSLLISFNDPDGSGIWNVWQILNQYANVSMLAQPFIITENNVQARISIAEMRLLPGPAEVQSGNGIVQRQEPVNAAISIDLLPRINLNNNINLQIVINVNEFLSAANNKITRVVQTNANIGNGEVLALGGLIKTTDTLDIDETPLLAKIPIVGWFFKKQQKARQKSNLMVFICPTIIEPKVSGRFDTYTKKKLHLAQDQLTDHVNFENLKDPITRWFFKPDVYHGEREINNYVHGRLDTTFCDNPPQCDAHPYCEAGQECPTPSQKTVCSTPPSSQLKKRIVSSKGNPLKRTATSA